MTKRPVPEQSASAPEELPRRLNAWSTTALVIGLVIGSGVFRTPGVVASALDSTWLILAFWIAGGVLTLCLALCLAELATSFPAAGGVYIYLREAYGPGTAFVFGWTLLLIGPAMSAALALVFADYLGQVLALGDRFQRGVATAVLLFVTAANCYSVRFGAAVQSAAISAKVLALVALGACAFAFADGTGGAWSQPRTPTLSTTTGSGVLMALVAVMFSYDGIAGSCAVFGEVRNPTRTVPRALVTGVAAVMLLYVLANVAYLHVLPLERIAASRIVAADVMETMFPRAGAALIAGCIVLSTFGTLAGAAIVTPRLFFAMARDGLLFSPFGTVHPRHETPHLATLLYGMLAVAYVWLRGFEDLIAHYVLSLWPFLALAVLGLMRIRGRNPDAVRGFRTPGYPFVPAIVVVAGTGMTVAAFIEVPGVSFVNLGVLVLGAAAYAIWKRLRA